MASRCLLLFCFAFTALMWIVGVCVVDLPPPDQRFKFLPPHFRSVFETALAFQDGLVSTWGDMAIAMIDTAEEVGNWAIALEQSFLHTLEKKPDRAQSLDSLKELMSQIFALLRRWVQVTVKLVNRLNHQSTLPLEKVLSLVFRVMDSILGVPAVDPSIGRQTDSDEGHTGAMKRAQWQYDSISEPEVSVQVPLVQKVFTDLTNSSNMEVRSSAAAA